MPRGIPLSTFSNFQVLPHLEGVMDMIQPFRDNPKEWEQPILTLVGGVGSGKSHLLQALGWALLRAEVIVKYVFVPDFLQTLRDTMPNDSATNFEEVYGPLKKASVVLLDDVGFERPTPFAQEIIGRVVDNAHQGEGRLVITTNIEPWEGDGKRLLGQRLHDRMFDAHSGRVQVVHTGNVSFRTSTEGR